MYLIHPYNGDRQNVSFDANIGRFLGALFFGPIYFAVKGMWGAAFLWLLIVFPLSLCTFGAVGIIAAFFANGLYRSHLLAKGYVGEVQYAKMVAKGMAV